MKRDLAGALLWTLALLTAANAVWMVVQPASWYTELPAGVPDFGPYNEHFVKSKKFTQKFMESSILLSCFKIRVSAKWRKLHLEPLCRPK